MATVFNKESDLIAFFHCVSRSLKNTTFMSKKYEISVVGAGYVGLSNAILLAQNNNVNLVELDSKKVDYINDRISPIADPEIQNYLANVNLSLRATTCGKKCFADADFIIVATPTDYDESEGKFDTSSVESVIRVAISANPSAYIIVKSTIPVGFIERIRAELDTKRIAFSPEFLREGKALHDNLYPSRIIVGDTSKKASIFAQLLKEGAKSPSIPTLLTDPTEAESIKLFANTYLAMRVAYFNELDSFAEAHHLKTGQIIDGVCLDPRIGDDYNNPSFGYGGYCLPKDSKQLLANYKDVPNNLIKAIVEANETRKSFIAESIKEKSPKIVGVYRLIMKASSDNFRASAIFGVISKLAKAGIEIVIYEPNLDSDEFQNFRVINDLREFKSTSDLILANRMAPELHGAERKIYTRDIFGNN